ncbi:DUF885 domain-containing protein [Idiomarina tyrosinivorans]|uniref:DUF885 domain-containing protein n=1 Tax=Idiomarina tyrosinivorans TaxID=1445662 RepID=A0A432ZQ27_9GAMM|nr:DUF885 domain-containing protein [Idiomarina tyrosinivorans]RUO80045.1 DUF885 domain-containing protein [Idiomarina tyrosinivorans]
MRHLMVLLCLAAPLSMVGCASTTSQDSSAKATTQQSLDSQFSQLADRIWDGLSESDPRALPDMSAATLEQTFQRNQAWLNKLDSIDTTKLSQQNQMNYAMIRYALADAVDRYRFHDHYMPLTSEGGFHTELAFMPSSTAFHKRQDYEDYLAKLQTIPRYMEQQTAWLKKGIEEGFTQPAAAMKGFEESIAAYIVQRPQDSVFYDPFEKRPDSINPVDWALLQEQAADIIDNQVMPAYDDYFTFMVTEYLPNCRDSIGASELPNGSAWYNNRIMHYTTLDLSAEQIHQIGLQEVARIRAEMDTIIEKLDFKGSFADFVNFLRTDKRFYPQSADELMRTATYIAKKMDGKLLTLFNKLPRKPYGVEPVPAEIAPKYTTGRYKDPTRADEPGMYWVNTYALDRRPLYQMEALTFHEAVPGHHIQVSLALEMDDLPAYRQNTYISAFGEGWGLYAEYLGLEAGFYQDPYSNFGRLSYEMWRAARLVVDTGMHAMGWSRQQAIDYMAENTALSLHNCTTEIDRYITWPAQALSYKLGELTIKRLRNEAEEALGEDFDVRDFHDAVLENGSIPLQMLEQHIRQWIAKQKSA